MIVPTATVETLRPTHQVQASPDGLIGFIPWLRVTQQFLLSKIAAKRNSGLANDRVTKPVLCGPSHLKMPSKEVFREA